MNKNAGTLPLLLLILVALLGFAQVIFWAFLNLFDIDINAIGLDKINMIGSLVPNILKIILSLSSFFVSVFLLFKKKFASKWLGFSLTALTTIVSISVATQLFAYVLRTIKYSA